MQNNKTKNPVKQVFSKSSHIRNPKGKGGFGEHPEFINKKGPPRKQLLFTNKLLDSIEKNPDLLKKMAKTLFDLAIANKDLAALKEIADRIEGKSVQRSEISGTDGEPLQGLVIVKNEDTPE